MILHKNFKEKQDFEQSLKITRELGTNNTFSMSESLNLQALVRGTNSKISKIWILKFNEFLKQEKDFLPL